MADPIFILYNKGLHYNYSYEINPQDGYGSLSESNIPSWKVDIEGRKPIGNHRILDKSDV